MGEVRLGIELDSSVLSGAGQTLLGGSIGPNLQIETDDLLIDATAAAELLVPFDGGSAEIPSYNVAFHFGLLGQLDPDVWLGGQLGVTEDIESLTSGDLVTTGEAGVLFLANVTDHVGLTAYTGLATTDFDNLAFSGGFGVRFSWDVASDASFNAGDYAERPDLSNVAGTISSVTKIDPDHYPVLLFEPVVVAVETDGPVELEASLVVGPDFKHVLDLGTHTVDGETKLSFFDGREELPDDAPEIRGHGYRIAIRQVGEDKMTYVTDSFYLWKR